MTVEEALDLYGAPVYVRKQIVHNKHVVSNLEKRGAIFVEELDEVPPGATVVFSAHGVSPAVHRQAAERELKTIDATCPLVTKVHREAVRFAREGYTILLIGHAGHEEVEGTAGEAPDQTVLVEHPDDVDNLDFAPDAKLAWLSQTTLSVDETMETVRRLRAKFPQLEDPPSDDICYATQNRQVAVKEIGATADLVIVVGSANSSNSVRLVEVALEAGAKASYRVDDVSPRSTRPGSRASAPSASPPVRPCRTTWCRACWASSPSAATRTPGPVQTAEESLVFSLPKELHRDLKAAGRP